MLFDAETLRPKTWADYLHTPDTERLMEDVKSPTFERASILITGVSGSGKTTLARLLAATVCGGSVTGSLDYIEIDGSEVNKEWASTWFPQFLRSYSWHGKDGWKVVVVNHAEMVASNPHVLSLLKKHLEDCPLPRHRMVIFTSTQAPEELFNREMLGRLCKVELTANGRAKQGMAQAGAAYLQGVASRHNMNGRPLAHYLELYRKHAGNVREALRDLFESDGQFSTDRH